MVQITKKLLIPIGIVFIAIVIASIWVATGIITSSSHTIRELDKKVIINNVKTLAHEIGPVLALGDVAKAREIVIRSMTETNIPSAVLFDVEGNPLFQAGDPVNFKYHDFSEDGYYVTINTIENVINASASIMDNKVRIGTVLMQMPLTSFDKPVLKFLVPVIIIIFGFGVAILVGKLILKDMSNEIRGVVEEAREITRGNLNGQNENVANKKGTLHLTILEMAYSLQKNMREIKAAAETVDHTGQKLFEEIIKSMEHSSRFRENISKVSDIAAHFLETSSQVGDDVNRVSEQAEAAVQRILALGSKAQQISKVTTAINEIAKRINLLSLNASIEAVQAGEHGQGFAVVASEIRKLAESTKRSIQDIGELVEDIQSATNSTLLSTEQTVDSVKRITIAVQEQGAASKQVRMAVNEINNDMQQGWEMASGLVGNAEELRQATTTLSSGFSKFDL